jgi:glycosyltransferase involved in cell wall biosynthesis
VTTVVLAARNEARRLPATLGALVGQGAHEVIVVDDGSADGTAEVAARAGATVLRAATRGAAAARNVGIRASQGHLVAFLDAHCVPEPGWLAALQDACAPLRVGGVQGAVAHHARDPRVGRLIAQVGEADPESVLHASVRGRRDPYPWVRTGNALFRRDALLEAGLFDERLALGGEDADLGWRLVRLGWQLVHAPQARADHWDDATPLAFLRKVFRYGRAAARLAELYREHGARTALAARRPLARLYGAGLALEVAATRAGLRAPLPARPREPVAARFRPWFRWDDRTELQVSDVVVYWDDGPAVIVVSGDLEERLELVGSAAVIFRALAAGRSRDETLARLGPSAAPADLEAFIGSLLEEEILRRR